MMICHFCDRTIPDGDCVHMVMHTTATAYFHPKCCEAGRVILWLTVGTIERVGLPGRGRPGPIDSWSGH